MTTATITKEAAWKLPDLDTVYHCEELGPMTLGQMLDGVDPDLVPRPDDVRGPAVGLRRLGDTGADERGHGHAGLHGDARRQGGLPPGEVAGTATTEYAITYSAA